VSDDSDNVFSRLRSRSEEMLTQVTAELMSNPQFSRAVQQALKGKQFLDDAAARALKQANIPTRTEFRRAVSRVASLESEVALLRERLERAETAASRKSTAPKRTAPKKTAPRKTASKKTAPRKTSSRAARS